MYIAKQLRKENIIEYLLYMWQIEDLMRAFNLDLDLVNNKIVETYHLNANEKQSLYEWYESIIDMMRREGVQNLGHLQINKNTLNDLNEFHDELLKSGENPSYSAKFYHILPYINQLKNQKNNSLLSDLELCFNFLYGIMVLKMKKVEISKESSKVQVEISKFFILLAQAYKEEESKNE